MVNEFAAPNTAAPRGSANGAGPSRSRKTVLAEEDASKLQFGEFSNGEALTPTEVARLLTMARTFPGVPPPPDNKVYKSTREYVNEFKGPLTDDLVENMRASLNASPGFLNAFEITQIVHLRPERVEVAVALIPSLERYANGDESETQLQQMLDEVRSAARYAPR